MFHRDETACFFGFFVGGGCADVGADFVGTDGVEEDVFFLQDFAEGADETYDGAGRVVSLDFPEERGCGGGVVAYCFAAVYSTTGV